MPPLPPPAGSATDSMYACSNRVAVDVTQFCKAQGSTAHEEHCIAMSYDNVTVMNNSILLTKLNILHSYKSHLCMATCLLFELAGCPMHSLLVSFTVRFFTLFCVVYAKTFHSSGCLNISLWPDNHYEDSGTKQTQ